MKKDHANPEQTKFTPRFGLYSGKIQNRFSRPLSPFYLAYSENIKHYFRQYLGDRQLFILGCLFLKTRVTQFYHERKSINQEV